jgi:SAM-dependent methyltransferase
MSQRPDYGVDAPLVIAIQIVISVVTLGLAVLLFTLDFSPPVRIPLAWACLFVGVNCLLTVAVMLWYSKAGKLRQREQLLDMLPWRGDERVLDVGCGRGLLLVGAARRLTTGKAVGVDVWQSKDLSGNRPDAVLENARAEGVAERVEVQDGDARKLPFPDGSFDVVVSSLAIHNIPEREGRAQAMREIGRVLKPGGRLAMVDIQYTAGYVRLLRECGLADVARTAVGPLFCLLVTALTWGAVRFFRVTGQKTAA